MIEELIENVEDYNPSQLNNDVLADDFRICVAWTSTILSDEDFKYSQKQVNELAVSILKEIFKRKNKGEMNWTFNPDSGSEAYQYLWSKIKDRFNENEINTLKKELNQDVIAVALQEDKETISQVFDRAPHFAIIKDNEVEDIVDNGYLDREGEIAFQLIKDFQEEGITKIIAGDFGNNAIRGIEEINIKYETKTGKLQDLLGFEEKSKITLEEVIKAFKNYFDVDEKPAHIYLVGRVVNEGVSPDGHDIDILVKQNYRDEELINNIKNSLPSEVSNQLHFIFDEEGPSIGKFIPLYKLNYEKLFSNDYFLHLSPCPHQDNSDKCILKKKFAYKMGYQVKERSELTDYYEILQFPIKCKYADKFHCPYIKDYYYSWREYNEYNE